MTEYKIDRYNTTWVYQTYNKKYTTPRIFMSYDFNLSLMIASVITSIVLALMPSIYNPIMILDWMLAFVFLFNTIIGRNLYTSGALNAVVGEQSSGYNFARISAMLTQSALYRTIIPTIVVFCTQDTWYNSNMIILYVVYVGVAIACLMSAYGVGSDKKYYNHTAQSIYAQVLNGPTGDGSISDLLKNNLDFKMEKLIHPEIATNEYYAAENKFNKSAAKIENEIKGYDNEWRRAILFGDSFFYNNEFPANSAEAAMKKLLTTHKKNAMALNKIIVELNKIPYKPVVASTKTPTMREVVNREYVMASKQKARTASVSKPTVPQKQIDKNSEDNVPKPNNDVWGGNANWY